MCFFVSDEWFLSRWISGWWVWSGRVRADTGRGERPLLWLVMIKRMGRVRWSCPICFNGKRKKKQRKKEDNVITSLNCLVLDFPPPKPTYLFTWKSITRAVWLFFCKYLFLKTVLIWFLQQNLDENRENLNFPCKKKWILKKTERIEGEGGKGWQGLLRC